MATSFLDYAFSTGSPVRPVLDYAIQTPLPTTVPYRLPTTPTTTVKAPKPATVNSVPKVSSVSKTSALPKTTGVTALPRIVLDDEPLISSNWYLIGAAAIGLIFLAVETGAIKWR